LSSKEEAIASIKEKIKELNTAEKTDKFIITNILGNTREIDNLWKEFEVHFNQTHPGFYKILTNKYPELTQNEVRLCAFLKLNLNTKEIAQITQKTPRSIEVMRSRIRQKMDLERDVNIGQMLTKLQ
jgi:DNA-binding CsgD family transcriptional regulator